MRDSRRPPTTGNDAPLTVSLTVSPRPSSRATTGYPQRLSDAFIRRVRASDRPRKYWDGGGLYLYVTPQGAKLWRVDYRFHGRRRTASLGRYPIIGLAEARGKLVDIKQLLAHDTDPIAHRRAQQREARGVETFAAVADEWLRQSLIADRTRTMRTVMLDRHILPAIGSVPIRQLQPTDLLELMRRLHDAGLLATARRVRQIVGQVCRYAVATLRADRDITTDVRGALPRAQIRHHAAVTAPAAIGELMRRIDECPGRVGLLLQFSALTFARPAEIRWAEWSEIDVEHALWTIPARRMKMRRDHLVPLSRQALAVLAQLRLETGGSRWVFRSTYGRVDRPMNASTPIVALRRLGYDRHEMTPHGFRAMASTRLHELGWPSPVIERQLAHQDRDSSRRPYARAEYLAERRDMMQAWADELDRLRTVAPPASTAAPAR